MWSMRTSIVLLRLSSGFPSPAEPRMEVEGAEVKEEFLRHPQTVPLPLSPSTECTPLPPSLWVPLVGGNSSLRCLCTSTIQMSSQMRELKRHSSADSCKVDPIWRNCFGSVWSKKGLTIWMRKTRKMSFESLSLDHL